MNEFYRFVVAEADDEPSEAELLVFAPIGDWEDMGEVSARAFAKDLAKLPSSIKRLDIHINSPGGSLFEAQAIYSRLADHRAQKHVYVDGLAASAASIIAMVGHKIYMRANATMMIHLPSGLAFGNADDMRKMAGALDTVTESMINVYAKRTKQERASLRDMLAAETWMTPDQAVENGFADEVRGVVKAAAIVGTNRATFNGVEFDLSHFHNVPAFTATTTERPPMPNKPKKVKATTEEEEENGNGNGEGTETPTPPTETPPTQKPAAAAPPAPATPPPVTPPANDYDKGIAAERARIAALQALDRPATHAIVTAAIKDGKTASDIVAACMEAMDKANQQRDRRKDASVLDGIPGSDGTGNEESDFGQRLTKKAKARAAMRNRSRTRLSSSRN